MRSLEGAVRGTDVEEASVELEPELLGRGVACRHRERAEGVHEPFRMDRLLGPPFTHAPRAPAAEREHDLLELAAVVGELVDGGGGRRRQRPLPDHARVLQPAKPRREDVRADPGQGAGEVGVALGPEQEVADDEERPPVADQIEGVRDAAVLVVGSLVHRLLTL
jgi:hypothetical protein